VIKRLVEVGSAQCAPPRSLQGLEGEGESPRVERRWETRERPVKALSGSVGWERSGGGDAARAEDHAELVPVSEHLAAAVAAVLDEPPARRHEVEPVPVAEPLEVGAAEAPSREVDRHAVLPGEGVGEHERRAAGAVVQRNRRAGEGLRDRLHDGARGEADVLGVDDPPGDRPGRAGAAARRVGAGRHLVLDAARDRAGRADRHAVADDDHVGAAVDGPGARVHARVGGAGVDGGRAEAHPCRAGLPGGARAPAAAAVRRVGLRVDAGAAAERATRGAGAGAGDARLAGAAAVAAGAAVRRGRSAHLAPVPQVAVAVGGAGRAGVGAGARAAGRRHVDAGRAGEAGAAAPAVVDVRPRVDAAVPAGRPGGRAVENAPAAVAALTGLAGPAAAAAVVAVRVDVRLAAVRRVGVAAAEPRGADEPAAIEAAGRRAVRPGGAGVAARPAVARVVGGVDLAAVGAVAVAVAEASVAAPHGARAGLARGVGVGGRRAGVPAAAAVLRRGGLVHAGAAAHRPGDRAEAGAAPEDADRAPGAGGAAAAAVGAVRLEVDARAAAAGRPRGAVVAACAAVVAVGGRVDLAPVGAQAVEVDEARRAGHDAAAAQALRPSVGDGGRADRSRRAAVGQAGVEVDLAPVRRVAVDVGEAVRAGEAAGVARAGHQGVRTHRAGVAAAAAVHLAGHEVDAGAGALGQPRGAVEDAACRLAAVARAADVAANAAVGVVRLEVDAGAVAVRLAADGAPHGHVHHRHDHVSRGGAGVGRGALDAQAAELRAAGGATHLRAGVGARRRAVPVRDAVGAVVHRRRLDVDRREDSGVARDAVPDPGTGTDLAGLALRARRHALRGADALGVVQEAGTAHVGARPTRVHRRHTGLDDSRVVDEVVGAGVGPEGTDVRGAAGCDGSGGAQAYDGEPRAAHGSTPNECGRRTLRRNRARDLLERSKTAHLHKHPSCVLLAALLSFTNLSMYLSRIAEGGLRNGCTKNGTLRTRQSRPSIPLGTTLHRVGYESTPRNGVL
jgi:hypothetical protein